MPFYNTNSDKGKELKSYQLKALNQEEKVLQFFILNRRKNFTAWEVDKQIDDIVEEGMFITSIRRSIFSLVKLGKIKETGQLRLGSLGRRVRCYQYNNHNNKSK